MKIAVCLSAQPRSIEYAVDSILNFFNDPSYEVDFFCHAWDYNTWKTKEDKKIIFGEYEPVDPVWLETQLKRFNPKNYAIGKYELLYPKYQYMSWGSLFYSMMYANMLKLKYETENNFKYDYVVKSRYDVVFSPDRKFVPAYKVNERHLYFSHAGRMSYRYNHINASDPFFYGDSWGMDIVADSFTVIKKDYNNPFSRRLDQFPLYDPGTFISMICKRFNVIVDVDMNNPADIIFRKEAIGIDYKTNFDKILKIHSSYYE